MGKLAERGTANYFGLGCFSFDWIERESPPELEEDVSGCKDTETA